MTRWMAVSEFKALGFCLIHQIQSILRFPCELSLLTTGHSARSEAKSQNPKMKIVSGKKDLEGKISPDEETLNPLKNPSSSKNQIDPGKILILDFGVVGRG